MVTWLAGNRIRGTTAERVGASVAVATPTKIIDGNYTVLTYTANGKFIPKGSFNVEYLVIGGGGGGSVGGAGAGAYRTNLSGATNGGGASLDSTYGVTAQNYDITIGAGGAGSAGGLAGNGGNSNITPTSGTTITSSGGSGGVGNGVHGATNGTASGGGGGGSSSGTYNGGSGGTYGYTGGGNGGFISVPYPAGGGGGSSEIGQTAPSSSVSGKGGDGTSSSITGSAVTRAGGGGAGSGGTFGLGGSGGGGTNGGSGGSNTGSGGGSGGSGGTVGVGGTGGSGIVILRFLTSGNTFDVENIGLMPSLTSGVGGWHEVGRTTLGSTTKPITVSSIADKRYYMFLIDMNKSGNATWTIDTGSNYSRRQSYDGGSDGTAVSGSTLEMATANAGVGDFIVGYIANLSNKEKLFQMHWMYNSATGAGTAPTRGEHVGKWANTSNVIDTLELYNSQAGNYLSGSEVVVLGWDDSDTHTTNFWEELASVSGDGSSTTLSSGTITAKKYLWVQIYLEAASDLTTQLFTYNNDSASNYSQRSSRNGATDVTNTSIGHGNVNITGHTNAKGLFYNGFIINNSANEKLAIYHGIGQNTAGAGTAPVRLENVHKWANTSSQITKIDVDQANSVNFGAGSIM